MAQVSTLQSTVLSNRDAVPRIPSGMYGSGRAFTKKAVVVTNAADSATSKYGFFTIPSDAHIDSIKISSGAQGAGCTMDIGFYETTRNGGGFATTIAGGVAGPHNASALILTMESIVADYDVSGALSKVENLFANSSYWTVAKMDQPLWQILGFTDDPQRGFDLVASVTVATVAGGALCVEVQYHLQ